MLLNKLFNLCRPSFKLIINQGRRPTAANAYHYIKALVEGKEEHLLFTDTEIYRAILRAKSQPEDTR
jgi:hypothetical protein